MINLLQEIERIWDDPCPLSFDEAERKPEYAVYYIMPLIETPLTFECVENKASVQFDIYATKKSRVATLYNHVSALYDNADLDIAGFDSCKTDREWIEMDEELWKASIRFTIIFYRED